MLGGASMKWLIVCLSPGLHCKEIGSGGVDRVLLAVDGVQLWAFVKAAQSIWSCIEGGLFVDKLSNCDLFSEDSGGRHVVILFLHKF
jgi:hypothetical protein